MSPSM